MLNGERASLYFKHIIDSTSTRQCGYRADKSRQAYCIREKLITYGGRHLLVWRKAVTRHLLGPDYALLKLVCRKAKISMQDYEMNRHLLGTD